METIIELVDRLKTAPGLRSDYAIAKRMGLAQSVISNWRHGRKFPSERQCFEIAAILEDDPAYIYACVRSESAASDILRQGWKQEAERMAVNQ